MTTDNSHFLSDQIKSLGESATLKMSALARELGAQGHDVISLSIGQPDFDTPKHIKDAAKEALDKGITGYTPVPGSVKYRQAIVDKFKRENGLDYSMKQIVVSNGAKQCIANICLALCNSTDEVIIFTPYWVSYIEIVKFAGGIPVIVKAPIESDFKVSAEQLEAAITANTKLIIFSSPCNPTGSVYTRPELESIAAVLRKHKDIFVISDEIYEHINFGDPHTSFASLDGMYDRTITVNGMSKGFAMTGWRLGYMAAPEWLASACAKIQGQFTSGASAFGQYAAAVALDSDLSATKEMRKEFERRKHMIIGLLKEIPGFRVNDPQGAFYIFPNVSDYFGKTNGKDTIIDADSFAMEILNNAHVACVSGSAFGNDDCIRISYAASVETLREAVRRIKTFLSDFK